MVGEISQLMSGSGTLVRLLEKYVFPVVFDVFSMILILFSSVNNSYFDIHLLWGITQKLVICARNEGQNRSNHIKGNGKNIFLNRKELVV